jgi:hypothetical protein
MEKNGGCRMTREKVDVDRFYALLDKLAKGLGGRRDLKDCNGRLDWPERGVYFFFEPGEFLTDASTPRVVRVGTHALKDGASSTLWGRLRTHRGALDGAGNHRASIFRLHVGNALIAKSNGAIKIPTWGEGQSAPKNVRAKEEHLEKEVSRYIGDMSLLWLSVQDAPGPNSDRAYIERNCIGLLASSDCLADKGSNGWLGDYSPNNAIRTSGLWNVDYVFEKYCPRFLDVFDKYIDITLG